ncbi:MAG: hypothetical protein ACRDO4_01480 [Nocardioides sp.]
MKDLDLAGVLERATADLPVVDRSRESWRRAQHVRRRRTGAAAGAAVVLVVVGVAGASMWQRGDGDVRPPISTPTDTPDVAADAVPVRWDPFTLPDEPRGATVLPERLEPPDSAPSVLDAPLPAAVVAWPEEGRDLMLLGTNGDWRTVPGTANRDSSSWDEAEPELTADGGRVAISLADGVLVVDVTDGGSELVPWPDPVSETWDGTPALRWLPGETELVVLHWKQTWLMDLDGGFRPAPFGGEYGDGLAIDPAGPVWDFDYEANEIVRWDGDEVVDRVPGPPWGNRWVARGDVLAFTGSPGDRWNHSGPVVLDARTGRVVGAASIKDPSSVYSDNAYLTAQGFLDEETLLLLVAPMDFDTMEPGDQTWFLAAWDFREGTFERLTEGDTRMGRIDVATALVEDGSP